jgi:acyl carrier protein
MNMKTLLAELKQGLVEEFELEDVDPQTLTEDTEFFQGGLGLDSVDLLALVAFLDREYGVEIFTRELGEKVFVNLGTLARYILEHRR